MHLSSLQFVLLSGLLVAILAALYFWRLYVTAREAHAAYRFRRGESSIDPEITEADFVSAWEKAYSPRGLGYATIAAAGAAVLFPLLSWVFSTVWRNLWLDGLIGDALEPGTIIHSFFGAMFVVAVSIVVIAWPLMWRFQKRRPGTFESELAAIRQGA